jgi:hypothetical protein
MLSRVAAAVALLGFGFLPVLLRRQEQTRVSSSAC